MLSALLLLASAPVQPSITLDEAREMTGQQLAERLLPGQIKQPIVDVILNGRGLTPPSRSLYRLWLVERMVPFDDTTCRSHSYVIDLLPNDPAANMWTTPFPTHPVKVVQYDGLWVPKGVAATIEACAGAPSQASGFGDGGLGLAQASALVRQARSAFSLKTKRSNFQLKCRGRMRVCGANARRTLSEIDWSALGLVEQVDKAGESLSIDDPVLVDKGWGPKYVQFTFPYAADYATWVVTVQRSPEITKVTMQAEEIVYE